MVALVEPGMKVEEVFKRVRVRVEDETGRCWDSGGISGSISASNCGIRSRAVVRTKSRSTASYP